MRPAIAVSPATTRRSLTAANCSVRHRKPSIKTRSGDFHAYRCERLSKGVAGLFWVVLVMGSLR
jgi:hypothetical protein